MNDETVKYLSIKELFQGRIFRIPDYQRGFSWEKEHCEAFWKDLINLQEGKLDFHYTGMITVEEIGAEQYQHWEDRFYFKNLAKGYFVVDGQQRLTAITILLHSFIKKYFALGKDVLNDNGAIFWQEQYLCRPEVYGNPASFIFGYQTDNPSDLFFKSKILEQKGIQVTEETAYTNNLLVAKRYFEQQIEQQLEAEGLQKAPQKLEALFITLIEKFKFDFKVLNKDLDIFMVFETMNTRGKLLSNLENLKNRLIYLSTILYNKTQAVQDTNKYNNQLRTQIVEAWKGIYKELGRDKNLANTDDTLLNYHWIMYHKYDRSPDAVYEKGLFEKKFTVESTIQGELSVPEVKKYVDSLAEAAKWWFVLNNPLSTIAKEYVALWCEDESEVEPVIVLLTKINTLSPRFFVPVIFAALSQQKQLIPFLETVERYLFLLFTISGRRSNTGSYHFRKLASALYKNDWDMNNIIGNLESWIYGGEDYYGYLNIDAWYQGLEFDFEHQDKKGYQSWSGIKYFLAVYSGKFDEIVKEWNQYKVVPIYNNTKETAGFAGFDEKQYTVQQRRRLRYSLGNLVLIKSTDRNEKIEKWPLYKLQNVSQLDALKTYSVWTPQAILEQGKNMLVFLEKHWNLKNTYKYRRPDDLRLLFLEFMTPVTTEEVD